MKQVTTLKDLELRPMVFVNVRSVSIAKQTKTLFILSGMPWDQVFFFFITLGLEMSDKKVYEPQIRALLGTASNHPIPLPSPPGAFPC